MGLFTKISVTSELTAVGNISSLFPPDYTDKVIFHDRTEFTTELGYKIIFLNQSTKFRTYTLVWSALALSQLTTIESFYNSHEADLIPFLFTPPDETSNLKFIFNGNLIVTKQDNNVYSCEVEIEQILLGA